MMDVNPKPQILVLIEYEGHEIAPVSYELLHAGQELASLCSGEVAAVICGYEVEGKTRELTNFVSRIYSLDDRALGSFQPEIKTLALEQLSQKVRPDIFFFAHNLENGDIAPRLAFRLKAGLTTDCINVSSGAETGSVRCTKPVYGGNAIATFETKVRPYIVTVRAKSYEPVKSGTVTGEIIQFQPDLKGLPVGTRFTRSVITESVSLDKAEVVVSGGRGIGRIEGLELLKNLAESLKKHFDKVELGASRPLIDMHWLPSSRQVGLTGEKVNPLIYFAVGISGASQHMSGIGGARIIVAINRDRRAPIFSYADYGVVGNYEEVMPALTRRINELPVQWRV